MSYVALILVCLFTTPCRPNTAVAVLQVPDEFMTYSDCIQGGRAHVKELGIRRKQVKVWCKRLAF